MGSREYGVGSYPGIPARYVLWKWVVLKEVPMIPRSESVEVNEKKSFTSREQVNYYCLKMVEQICQSRRPVPNFPLFPKDFPVGSRVFSEIGKARRELQLLINRCDQLQQNGKVLESAIRQSDKKISNSPSINLEIEKHGILRTRDFLQLEMTDAKNKLIQKLGNTNGLVVAEEYCPEVGPQLPVFIYQFGKDFIKDPNGAKKLKSFFEGGQKLTFQYFVNQQTQRFVLLESLESFLSAKICDPDPFGLTGTFCPSPPINMAVDAELMDTVGSVFVTVGFLAALPEAGILLYSDLALFEKFLLGSEFALEHSIILFLVPEEPFKSVASDSNHSEPEKTDQKKIQNRAAGIKPNFTFPKSNMDQNPEKNIEDSKMNQSGTPVTVFADQMTFGAYSDSD